VAVMVPEYLYRKLDRVQVKGRQEAVDILEPIGLREQCTQHQRDAVTLFSKGVQAYTQREWDEAALRFSDYLCLAADDVMARIYLHRIAEYKSTPPPRDWDGVFSHTSK
jgi:adenylate cyclase